MRRYNAKFGNCKSKERQKTEVQKSIDCENTEKERMKKVYYIIIYILSQDTFSQGVPCLLPGAQSGREVSPFFKFRAFMIEFGGFAHVWKIFLSHFFSYPDTLFNLCPIS
jgi:hypothetical protein